MHNFEVIILFFSKVKMRIKTLIRIVNRDGTEIKSAAVTVTVTVTVTAEENVTGTGTVTEIVTVTETVTVRGTVIVIGTVTVSVIVIVIVTVTGIVTRTGTVTVTGVVKGIVTVIKSVVGKRSVIEIGKDLRTKRGDETRTTSVRKSTKMEIERTRRRVVKKKKGKRRFLARR